MAPGLQTRKFATLVSDGSTAALDDIHTSYGTTIAGKYTTAAPTFTNGQYGHLRMTSDGKLMVDTELTVTGLTIDNIFTYSSDGAVTGAGYGAIDANGHVQVDVLTMPGSLTGYAEDTAHTTADVGIQMLAVRNDAYAVFTDTDGDYSPISVTAGGKVHTQGEGFLAHDAVDSGNPVKVGGYAVTTQRTAVANGDRVDLALTKSGEVILSTYDYSTQANRSSEIDPVSGHHMSETLAAVTNGADDTYYYYFDMDGYRYFSLQGALGPGSGDVTATIEISIQDDGTAPSSCTYVDATSTFFGVASYVASVTPTFISILDEPVAVKYVRVKIVAATAAADDGDWTIFMKKMF